MGRVLAADGAAVVTSRVGEGPRLPNPLATGRCVCDAVRYRLDAPPLFTHACHCLDCQKKTGTAFAMTTIVLRDDLVITHGSTRPTAASLARMRAAEAKIGR